MTASTADNLLEAWGDIVDSREWLTDTPDFGLGGFAGGWQPFTSINDRLDGKYLPYYQCEQDLARIRGAARMLPLFSSVPWNAMQVLSDYTFGEGYTFQAKAAAKQDVPENLIAAVQSIIDQTLKANDFNGDLDREINGRSREDGEALIRLYPGPDGLARLAVIEPDQLTQPANTRPLEDWLGCDDFVSSWSFGVHTRADDTSCPLGYHVVYDGTGANWDYIPTERFEHFKRNVTRNAKRGVNDYLPTGEEIAAEKKLSRNMAEGGALQAAIAWIEQWPKGTKQSDVQALNTTKADATRKRPTENGGTRTTNARRFSKGSILHVTEGKEYLPGPLGAERVPHFLEIAQHLLRKTGIRWVIPEYMISGDASNGNFASTLVAESPFVKAREADQFWFGQRFIKLLWKALKIAYESGRFARFGLRWFDLVSLIEIAYTAPEVASRDQLQAAEARQLDIGSGCLSVKTAIAESGRDPDVELANIAEQPPPAATVPGVTPPAPKVPPPPKTPTMLAAVQGALESVRTGDEARAILEQLREGVYP